ncbi:hypothetical protein [Cellulosimicrobium marinum]|uniref:hypothetical protein n=1 Tax=Cellulosimicrobium marinum TaxID=1638992 RepID=UPI001E5C3E80|nr:hypothetical protein [Cellulosimicrobium marinum]MCB7136059.1 hypothetical protein [Cellulosimicrobium marinum]
MSHYPGQAPPPPPRRGGRTPEGAIRLVKYWLPVIATLSLGIAALLLGGLLTGAWEGEGKNAARWFGVVTGTALGVFAIWVRVLAMRKIRSGEYPPR